MTLFEYLAVSVSIVLSFGVIRLLDGLPHVLKSERRYWVHIIWVVNVLWAHAQLWWTFWSYNTVVVWNYPRFLLALLAPAVLYSIAITVVPSASGSVSSWRKHFYLVRVRFCMLFAFWFVAIALSTWLVLGQPFVHPLRAIQGSFVLFFIVGAYSRSPKVHGVLAVVFLVLLLLSVLFFFAGPAPLNPLP